jgi:hypothetical protein
MVFVDMGQDMREFLFYLSYADLDYDVYLSRFFVDLQGEVQRLGSSLKEEMY